MYQKGDVLCVQYPGFKHYGIYIGSNRVIHNSKKYKKVCEIELEDFIDGRKISVSSIQAKDGELAITKALQFIDLPYGLFSENCEHFVRTVCGLEKESIQVQKYFIGAFGLSALGVGVLMKSRWRVLRTVGGAVAMASVSTSKETSPVKNVILATCLAIGVSVIKGKKR